jgi:hypothetical protein
MKGLKMEITIKNFGNKFKVVITNSSFGWDRSYTFTTKAEAENFVNAEKLANIKRLEAFPTISDFFNITN